MKRSLHQATVNGSETSIQEKLLHRSLYYSFEQRHTTKADHETNLSLIILDALSKFTILTIVLSSAASLTIGSRLSVIACVYDRRRRLRQGETSIPVEILT